jgi:lysozyme
MKFSINCVNLIKQFEGFRNKVYKDAVGIPTIGYGSTEYQNGTKVTMSDPPITEPAAVELLLAHLNKNVLPILVKTIKVELAQNKIDALGCLIYNIGSGNFNSSSLLRSINEQKPLDVIEHSWLAWNKGRVSGELQVLKGLTTRRQSEFDLFKTP